MRDVKGGVIARILEAHLVGKGFCAQGEVVFTNAVWTNLEVVGVVRAADQMGKVVLKRLLSLSSLTWEWPKRKLSLFELD